MSDGKSNWLKGLVLCAAYTVLAAVSGPPDVLPIPRPTRSTLPHRRHAPLPSSSPQAFFFHVDPPGVNGATWVNKDATATAAKAAATEG